MTIPSMPDPCAAPVDRRIMRPGLSQLSMEDQAVQILVVPPGRAEHA
jgi:hypothetical protein